MFLFRQVLTTGEQLGQEDNLDPDTQLLRSVHSLVHWVTMVVSQQECEQFSFLECLAPVVQHALTLTGFNVVFQDTGRHNTLGVTWRKMVEFGYIITIIIPYASFKTSRSAIYQARIMVFLKVEYNESKHRYD